MTHADSAVRGHQAQKRYSERRREPATDRGRCLNDLAGRRLRFTDVAGRALHFSDFAWRRLRRGFNQATELAAHLDRPVVHALWRVRPTASQTGLTAHARRRNVRGAFRLSPLLSAQTRARFITDAVVVLVDDVMTTGATSSACADVLVAAGARDVHVITLARA